MFLLFLIILRKITKSVNKLKVCLCSIGKTENLYVQEYVEYYRKLGYDKIFLYDNNDKNEEAFQDILNNK